MLRTTGPLCTRVEQHARPALFRARRTGLGRGHELTSALVHRSQHLLGAAERIRGLDRVTAAVEGNGEHDRGREQHRQHDQLFCLAHRDVDLRS
jgi:hypothetical protein